MIRTVPAYDPATHTMADTYTDEVAEDRTVVRTYDVRALTPDETAARLAETAARLVAGVKADAGRRILLIAPEWMQRNLTARAAELALTYPGLRGDELPEPERSEYLAGQAVWDRIKAIRTASNAIEMAIGAATTVEDLLAIDLAAGWPE